MRGGRTGRVMGVVIELGVVGGWMGGGDGVLDDGGFGRVVFDLLWHALHCTPHSAFNQYSVSLFSWRSGRSIVLTLR